MRLEDRLRRMVDGVPDEGLVTLPASLLRQWLKDQGVTEEPGPVGNGGLPDPGLTVNQVADHVDRDPSTVRGWLTEGRFPNARKLGREWRIPRADLADLLNGADGSQQPARARTPELSGGGDLGAWRRERGR